MNDVSADGFRTWMVTSRWSTADPATAPDLAAPRGIGSGVAARRMAGPDGGATAPDGATDPDAAAADRAAAGHAGRAEAANSLPHPYWTSSDGLQITADIGSSEERILRRPRRA